MIFTTGYDWLDLTYLILAIFVPWLYVFKPWREKTGDEFKKAKTKVIGQNMVEEDMLHKARKILMLSIGYLDSL